MKIALISWPFFANVCEKTAMTIVYFFQKITNKNHQCYVVVLIKKKIIKITLFSFLLGRGGGHFDKNGGGGGVILTNTHIFYQKVIRSEF